MVDEYIRKADAVSIAESYEVKRDGFHLNDYEYGRNQVADSIASDLEDMPPADVVQVVHSRWKCKCGEIQCPECGNRIRRIDLSGCLNFCPNCGVKMDG